MTGYRIADQSVEEALERRFHVMDGYIELGFPTYVIAVRGVGDEMRLLKEGFKLLVEELRPLGYIPKLMRVDGRYRITVVQRPPSSPPRHTLNVVLLAATAGTIFFDGFLRSNNPVLTKALMPGTPAFVNALLFTLAILGIFGLHELGHKAVTLLRGTEASMPYFIPAPPGMGGTFGAVITQKEPPTNRDALFDLGFSGPFVGFLITVIVSIVGLRLSFTVSPGEVDAWMAAFPEIQFQAINFPLLIGAIASILKPEAEGMVMVLHPLGFAAWVGCIVTFINLIPTWQLDGGHMSRALVGERHHGILSMAGIALMFISGFWIMAIMISFLMMRSRVKSGAPLDDISPLSASRKALFLVYLAMMVLTMVTLPF
ncbi:hypothetical protein AC482_03965 [miscellaneous Crenarchaeota group-15 archaeon DG-45]|uniref:Peptidase M50 domain-containing protein n=1 Tax=miscellaneous Crenarchaeota group-15 archaeon DG-45 TaxID=1685127 RepID=A0A0M0BPI2_9ARCH|nr:MAG: hypothetical protein AC482_03965 [miscellaneous Crenarchaeota group-15 archaeon DG-45]